MRIMLALIATMVAFQAAAAENEWVLRDKKGFVQERFVRRPDGRIDSYDKKGFYDGKSVPRKDRVDLYDKKGFYEGSVKSK